LFRRVGDSRHARHSVVITNRRPTCSSRRPPTSTASSFVRSLFCCRCYAVA
jgi:hypothetical protein